MKLFMMALLGMSLLVFTSCSEKESIKEAPTVHDAIELDINENGIADYTIKYNEAFIKSATISGPTYGIFGSLKPNNKNEILWHSEERNLFLRDIEKIVDNVEEPLNWRHTLSSIIVEIATNDPEGEWPDKWDINSEDEYSTYFLGLKLVSDSEIQLAWVEISINTSDGSISIVDKGIL